MKKILKYVMVVGIVILAGFALIKGTEYYQDRYIGTYYYGLVQSETVIEPEKMYDDSGKVMGKGYTYKLRCYNEKGEQVISEFPVYEDKAENLYQNGTYLKIEQSKQLSLKQIVITEDEVPEKALQLIKSDLKENK